MNWGHPVLVFSSFFPPSQTSQLSHASIFGGSSYTNIYLVILCKFYVVLWISVHLTAGYYVSGLCTVILAGTLLFKKKKEQKHKKPLLTCSCWLSFRLRTSLFGLPGFGSNFVMFGIFCQHNAHALVLYISKKKIPPINIVLFFLIKSLLLWFFLVACFVLAHSSKGLFWFSKSQVFEPCKGLIWFLLFCIWFWSGRLNNKCFAL